MLAYYKERSMDMEELRDRVRFIEMCKTEGEEVDMVLSGRICQEYSIMSDDKCICGYCDGEIGDICNKSDRVYWVLQ